jgi:hypothetical protein
LSEKRRVEAGGSEVVKPRPKEIPKPIIDIVILQANAMGFGKDHGNV